MGRGEGAYYTHPLFLHMRGINHGGNAGLSKSFKSNVNYAYTLNARIYKRQARITILSRAASYLFPIARFIDRTSGLKQAITTLPRAFDSISRQRRWFMICGTYFRGIVRGAARCGAARRGILATMKLTEQRATCVMNMK